MFLVAYPKSIPTLRKYWFYMELTPDHLTQDMVFSYLASKIDLD